MIALKKYKVSVFGEQYTFVTDEEELNFFNSIEQVDSLMRSIAQKNSSADPKKVALLAALTLALKYKSLEQSYAQQSGYLEKLALLLEPETKVI